MRIYYLNEHVLNFRYDFVRIYDGENEFATELAALTGILPSPVESTGNTVFINFQSDYGNDDDLSTGFKIEYEAGEGHCHQQVLIQHKLLHIGRFQSLIKKHEG